MPPRPSPLGGTILGLILERPGYGYELTRRLNERLGPAWQLPESAVYGVLDFLEGKGFVQREITEVDRPRARERVTYHPTATATAEFERWLRTRTRKEPIRTELLAKLAVARLEHADSLLEALTQYEKDCLAMLTAAGDADAPRQDTWEHLIACVIEDAAVDHLQAEIDWTRKARDRVSEFLQAEAGDP
jgi:DNA-binding PadR family transcriptional regulator